MDDIYKMFFTFLFSTVGTAIVMKVVNRRTESANVQKILTETDSQSFIIRSEQLQKWINIGSNAQEEIGRLRMEVTTEKISKIHLEQRLGETEEKLSKCTELMLSCKDAHKCKILDELNGEY